MGNECLAESLPELKEPAGGERANAEILGTIDQSETDALLGENGSKRWQRIVQWPDLRSQGHHLLEFQGLGPAEESVGVGESGFDEGGGFPNQLGPRGRIPEGIGDPLPFG